MQKQVCCLYRRFCSNGDAHRCVKSQHRSALPGELHRRGLLISGPTLMACILAPCQEAAAVEQGIKASDYTVPALSSEEYANKIQSTRTEAWNVALDLIDRQRFMELSNTLVLPPIDDLRQFVLYIPSALLKEGKRQEAIGSRKAYTDYLRELKILDELAQKASRFDADEEDVRDSLDRLGKRLDSVLSFVSQ